MLFLLIKILISLLISLLIIMLGFLFRVSGFSVQGFKVFPVGFRVFSYILKIVAFKLAQIPQKKLWIIFVVIGFQCCKECA